MDARLLIVGLAPGLRGANRTGRPFTGDYAGDLLYQTLSKFRFATGTTTNGWMMDCNYTTAALQTGYAVYRRKINQLDQR